MREKEREAKKDKDLSCEGVPEEKRKGQNKGKRDRKRRSGIRGCEKAIFRQRSTVASEYYRESENEREREGERGPRRPARHQKGARETDSRIKRDRTIREKE